MTEPETAETQRQSDGVGDTGDVLTVRDVARYLKLPISTVYALAQRGQLPGRKLGRQWRFFKPRLEAWLLARSRESNLVKRAGQHGRHQPPPDVPQHRRTLPESGSL